MGYVGPRAFVNDANQKLEYVFNPYGLLDGASIIIKKPE